MKKKHMGAALFSTSLSGLLLVAACDAGMSRVGEVLTDAGAMMVDAGDALAPVAMAQDTHDLSCDVTSTYTESREGYVTTTTTYFAELRDPAISPATLAGADVVVCGRENFDPAAPCPDGATCTGERYPYRAPCITGGLLVSEGLARVQCGVRGEAVSSAGTTVYGERFRTARVTLR